MLRFCLCDCCVICCFLRLPRIRSFPFIPFVVLFFWDRFLVHSCHWRTAAFCWTSISSHSVLHLSPSVYLPSLSLPTYCFAFCCHFAFLFDHSLISLLLCMRQNIVLCCSHGTNIVLAPSPQRVTCALVSSQFCGCCVCFVLLLVTQPSRHCSPPQHLPKPFIAF